MDTSGRIPWAVLGIADDATLDDARRAFRQLAKSLHPDVGGDGAAFATVVEAYRAAVAAVVVPAGPGPAPSTPGPGAPRRVTPYDWTVRPAAPAPHVWAEVAARRPRWEPPAHSGSAAFATVLAREVARVADAA